MSGDAQDDKKDLGAAGKILTKQIHHFEKAMKRRGCKRARAKQRAIIHPWHWHRRIIGEMRQNATIRTKIVDGKFDTFLGN